MTVTLTEIAELRLRTFLRAKASDGDFPQRGIRLAVEDGGCSGYQYALKIANAPKPDDITEPHGKLNIYIDSQSVPLLEGVVIDYIDSLMEGGFKFSNPNATESCSCGTSFKAGDCSPAGVPCS
jgi:iron-sulfur cluster assembly protein